MARHPPAETALYECLSSQRPIARDAPEARAPCGRLAAWLVEPTARNADPGRGRLVGVLLLANKAGSYDDEDRGMRPTSPTGCGRSCAGAVPMRVVSAMDHMERVMLGAIEALAMLGESLDTSKAGRARRVADLSSSIGTALGLPGHSVRGLRVIAQLIDVGMLQIPREILWRRARSRLLRSSSSRCTSSVATKA